MDKSEVRAILKSRIKAFSGKEEESRWIVEEILASKEFQEAETILAFCPLRSEPDIAPVLQDKRVLLPYVEEGRMKFSSSRRLVKSGMGFLEPDEKVEAPYEKALMIVPMLGFDKTGMRMGRGGGFYDRYIAENRERLYTLGVAFSVSELEKIPAEWNDMRLDRIIHHP